ncbi:predicted protein [Sparassis crispa]|uniref:Fork-head domain-containing protein n=1 Tax=Sparassis crispa TaxID=139825 RepID=A0A401G5J6_9APHY|nr:predicted protein [Sparassis crispa]GBE77427.1 predicted protein [Sparassis crispa]
MSNLNNLLNPETSNEYNLRVQKSRSPSSTSSPIENTDEQTATEPVYYTPTEITITPHEPHLNCPNALTCLQETDGRPQHTLPVILRCAILGSPKKRLTIREIYAAMEKKYPYYKTAGPAWKQSVRHHLSLNRLFERQPRPATDPGFGSYWTVNLDAPPGTKRPRKRGRANKEVPPGGAPVASTSQKRVKHQKSKEMQEKLPEPTYSPIATLRPVDSRSFSQTSTARAKAQYDDDDDMDYASGDGTHPSDDYESDDDIPFQFDPRVSSTSPLGTYPSRSVLHGAFSSYGSQEHPEVVVERLNLELAGLRRQSRDAVSANLRLSDQLAEAQAESRRTRTALRAAEARLEEEIRRRRQAEHAAHEEAHLRREAEDALMMLHSQRRPPGYSGPRT